MNTLQWKCTPRMHVHTGSKPIKPNAHTRNVTHCTSKPHRGPNIKYSSFGRLIINAYDGLKFMKNRVFKFKPSVPFTPCQHTSAANSKLTFSYNFIHFHYSYIFVLIEINKNGWKRIKMNENERK